MFDEHRCNPWFVRCLKPNNEKSPMKFDMPIVLEQLRYTGMLETIRIRQLGYPVRMRFGQFADRYRCLLERRPPRGTAFKEICTVILDAHTEGPRDRYQIGLNKVLKRYLKFELHRF